MRIGDRSIGMGHPAYVIAEIGVNHDGSASRAAELIDAAADAGADAIKLQLFQTELLLSRAAMLAMYQQSAGERDPAEMLKRLELNAQEMQPLAAQAHQRGIHAIVTVFSEPLVAGAIEAGFDGFKSASPDIVNEPLLRAMAAAGKPLVVSTGAASLDECARANGWLDAFDHGAFLHCVSSYPPPAEEASLRAMDDLALTVAPRSVGYSDHTTREDTGAIAVAAGASILEKHLSHDRSAAGPDHAASLEPDGFARYVRAVRDAEAMLGERSKQIRPIERDVQGAARQSVCTTRAMEAGHVLASEDVCIKRPGSGLEPWRLLAVVGQRLARSVEADVPLMMDDLEAHAKRLFAR